MAGVVVFPCPSEREEQDTVESVLEAELALLACGCPPQRMVVPQRPTIAGPQWKPTGFFATGTATAVVQLRGGDELKRSGQLLDEAVGVIEGAGGAAGMVPKPFFTQFSSNIWARSTGSGGGATGVAVGEADAAARVGGGAGAGIAGSDGWTRHAVVSARRVDVVRGGNCFILRGRLLKLLYSPHRPEHMVPTHCVYPHWYMCPA